MSDQCDIACHRLSFSEEEMSEYEQLRESIFKHLIKIDEQADGYSFIFPNAEGQLLQYLGKWIPFELKCCPFLKIAIAVNHDDNVRLDQDLWESRTFYCMNFNYIKTIFDEFRVLFFSQHFGRKGQQK